MSKKLYLWKLADFLIYHNKKMSAKELANHLNRNNIRTQKGKLYKGGRGTYKLLSSTYIWLKEKLNYKNEASKITESFVNEKNKFVWKKK